MFEDMAVKMAQVVTDYSQPIKVGEFVVIMASPIAMPIVQALHQAVIQRGAHPHVIFRSPPEFDEFLLLEGSDEQLTFEDPILMALGQHVDLLLDVSAPINTKSMSRIDPNRLQLRRQSARSRMKVINERESNGEIRFCILPWVTEGAAQQADMGLYAYTRFVYEACGLHLDDPIAYWSAMRNHQLKLVDYLKDKQSAHVSGTGIDLRFEFGERLWVSAHGDFNFPDGEIFTGPIEESVNGLVEFNLPAIYSGNQIEGIRLEFRDGVVVDASATKNEAFLISQLDLDEGARRLGEFAIGTNWGIQNLTGSILFDEKIGGTIHMALGESIPETLGVNESVLHWDIIHNMKDGGEIAIDGQPFYRAGQFLVEV